MQRVQFNAYGHENVIGEHKTTVELTSEDHLTKQGTCIMGVCSDMTLNQLDSRIKKLASLSNTKIGLRMSIDGLSEEITGTGSPGLTYMDPISMVARTSTFECERTLMVNADKAASDLNREFVDRLKVNGVVIECELIYITK
ncbi:MAG: DUF371 domain-containing protein [Candidatus Thorarchaeota archaeon]|jgi:hypothetical protein